MTLAPHKSVQEMIKTWLNQGFDPKEEDIVKKLADFFQASERTIYRRFNDLGISVATIKQQPRNLDPVAVTEIYKLNEFDPVEYEVKIDGYLNAQINSQILLVSDFQAGALKTAKGYDPTPILTVKLYVNELKKQLLANYSKYTQDVISNTDFYVFLLGDLVDGENIYLGQEVLPAWQQVKETTDIIYDLIQFIHGMGFANVDVHSVAGNHGRQPSKFVDQGTNWDTMLAYNLDQRYQIHREHSEAYENVSVVWTPDRFKQVKIKNWNFNLHHGDFTRGGFNLQRIEDKIRDWKLEYFTEANAWCIGHWHQIYMSRVYGMQLFINGSTFDSDFVKETMAKSTDFIFLLLTVGIDNPVDNVQLLDLSKACPPKKYFNLLRNQNP